VKKRRRGRSREREKRRYIEKEEGAVCGCAFAQSGQNGIAILKRPVY
jgi:hypothetical protein